MVLYTTYNSATVIADEHKELIQKDGLKSLYRTNLIEKRAPTLR